MEFETIKKDNRKKYIIGVIAILAIASVVFFVSTRANYKTTERLNLINTTVNYSPSDLDTVAIKVQNSSGGYDTVDTVPTSGYTLSDKSYCAVNGNKDTSISMEYKEGKVTIPVTSKGTKCYLYFDTKKTASQTLITKNEMVHETFTSDSGELVDTGYRYEGASPNNYVTFNNELWRIIGVFDVETASGSKEQLVKLIRNESIGNIAWDTYGSKGLDDWTQSDIKTILNGQYYNGEDINYTYRKSGSGKVSISGKSLNMLSRSAIQSVVWNLGSANRETPSLIFLAERGTKVYSERPTTWIGNVGLMYLSDYGFAVDSINCPRTTNLWAYNTDLCYTNNWLYNSAFQWTIISTPSDNYTIDIVWSNGYATGRYASYTYGVRPALYLKSNVSIVDNGNDGSQDHPYDLTI